MLTRRATATPWQAALSARQGKLLASDGPTEQYPDDFQTVLSKGPPSQVLYRANYVTHPSPLARWDDSYCAGRTPDADPLCFPCVTPHIGYTHDMDGRRLLTNRGQTLPQGYDDPNLMPPRETTGGGGGGGGADGTSSDAAEPPPPPM